MRSPEELAREKIDALLEQCGWILQNRSTIDLSAGRGIEAIRNLEKSLAANKRRALIQMATGSGKTYTAVNFVYRSSSSPARAESSSSSTAATSATRP